MAKIQVKPIHAQGTKWAVFFIEDNDENYKCIAICETKMEAEKYANQIADSDKSVITGAPKNKLH